MMRWWRRRSAMALVLVSVTCPAVFAQSNVLDFRPADINTDGDITYGLFVYNRLFSEGKVVFEALHLCIPGRGVVEDYRELSFGLGYRLVRRGGLQIYAVGHAGFASADARFLQPSALALFANGKWAGTSFVQRYVSLTDRATSAWLVDPAELQYRIAGAVSLGASVYLYRPDGGSAVTKVGPKVSIADRHGATELRVARVNQGESVELQVRRLLVF